MSDALVILLRVVTINIPIKVGARAWRRCWGLAQRHADIFGVNESLTAAQGSLYRRLARRKGYGQYGTRITPNPIFWNARKYRRLSGQVVQLHGRATGRLAARFPGYNAARSVTVVVLQPLGGGPEIAVLNAHWVPGGTKVDRVWRNTMRALSKRTVRRIAGQHRNAGRVVVLLGDLNVGHRFSLPPFTWIRAVGVDKIAAALPVGWRILRRAVHPFAAPTDHRRGYAARIRIARRK